ncbi:MAG: hypothetical protein F4151_16420 [Gammaproteobacteria bacterium]|nr:hypothetical protein [Gammaproteobacteria bacterium]
MSEKEKQASAQDISPRTAEFFAERGAEADIEAALRILRRFRWPTAGRQRPDVLSHQGRDQPA